MTIVFRTAIGSRKLFVLTWRFEAVVRIVFHPQITIEHITVAQFDRLVDDVVLILAP